MKHGADKKFLNRYFQSIYDKLEADAMMFNRKIPHEGLKGSENEQALAEVLYNFLPMRYGVEVNALVIDRNGLVSRQCDILIYENTKFPKYFRKVFPIEIVFAIIEVKTELSKQQVDSAKKNEEVLRSLEFQPLLTSYWETQTRKRKLVHAPPVHCIFGYRSSTEDFDTFIKWFAGFPTQNHSHDIFYNNSAFNHFIACSLDKGLVFCRGDGQISNWLTVGDESRMERYFQAAGDGHEFNVDPAKALLMFLETLWTMIEQSPRHPGFDIRSYMDDDLGSFIAFNGDGEIEC
ncbi:MAG: hypothetical protein K9N48_00900 [Verrucomicrobia bacterium]|nr:hypothetical protein [Verrucomicrobiota bacterium]MCF7707862.1 hypothetical protein [Verrucomicrobiota bacterium]